MLNVNVGRLRSISFLVGLFCAARFETAALAADANYRLHSGDVLHVTVFNEQALTQTVTILTDGSIVYPLVGRVNLNGETTEDASRRLARGLSEYVRNPIVNVAVATEGPLDVLVLGNVKTPGKYVLKPDERLTDAIAAAGGLGLTDGPLPDARISVGTQNVRAVSLQRLFRDGDVSLNAPLANDSVVYVPSPATIRVRVIGAVDKPGDIDVADGDRLSLAIAKAGNSANAQADLNHVHVTRIASDGSSHAFEVNLYQELEKGDSSADPVLQKGDVVYVPQGKGHGTANTAGFFASLLRLFIP